VARAPQSWGEASGPRLVPRCEFISRPRFSSLTYAGHKKLTRLPPRSAVVAFSATDVYTIAELIRRQRGGTAVVLGALSPRTRNAQVALYQSGDVDFLVATDAIGMGLNLDVDHVAFAGTRKYDGQVHRELTAGELGQIAGRAGRHMNDGTFGVTGVVEPFSSDLIDRLETHTFEPVKSLQWRNRDLDFASLDRLRDSLREAPREGRLARARSADDMLALESVSHDREVTAFAVCSTLDTKLAQTGAVVAVPGTQTFAQAQCPADAPHVVGGSLSTNFGGTIQGNVGIAALQPLTITNPFDGWRSWMDNYNGINMNLFAAAICVPSL